MLTDFSIIFRHPERLWWVVPVMIALFVLIAFAFRSARALYASHPILRLHGEGDRSVSRGTYIFGWMGSSLLVLLLAMAWAEPVHQKVTKETIWGGVRVAYLLDVSLSMKYAHDVAPFPDRLVAAKSILADFADITLRDPVLRGKYLLAIIPFAGEATTYLEFSKSREEFVEAIDAVDETTVGSPGTNMQKAMLEYERMWKAYPPKDEHTVDIVVIITDGGKGEGNRSDLPGIKATIGRLPPSVSIFTVGVGSVEQTTLPDGRISRKTIPVQLSSRDVDGRLLRHLLQDPKDASSKKLTSELDEEMLKMIAGDRGGYFFYGGKAELLASLKQVIIAKRKPEGVVMHVTDTDTSRAFLFPAFFIALFLFGYAQRIVPNLRSLWRRMFGR